MSNFSTDRALIVNAIDTLNTSIDWPMVRAALSRIERNKEKFEEVRDECKVRCIQHYMARAGKFKQELTLEEAANIKAMANCEAAKPNKFGQRSKLQDDAVRSGTNAWSYLLKTAQFISLEARGGANNTRKPRTPDTSTSDATEDAPVTLPNVVIPRATQPTDVNAFYLDSVRPFLVKAQKINASLFKGVKGNAILAAHTAFVTALNAAAELGDE